MCKQFGKAVECFAGNGSFWQLVWLFIEHYHSIQYMSRCACGNVWFDIQNVIYNPLCWLWRFSFSRTSIIQFKSSFAETSWFDCSLRAFPRPSNKRTNCPWKWLQLAVLRSFPLLKKTFEPWSLKCPSQRQELLSVVISSNCSQMGAIIQSPEKCFQICLFSVLAASPTQSLLLCFVTSCPSVTFRAIIASKCQLSKNGLRAQSVGRSGAQSNYPARK